jgi:uncharacterized membrane protein
MNSKIFLNNFSNTYFNSDKKFFDYQMFRIIKCHQKQPVIELVFRLFLISIPSYFSRLFDIQRYFVNFYSSKNEAILGSNQKNFEIRLYLYRHNEIPGIIILCFAISYSNLIGHLQSLFFRLLLFLFLPSTTKSLEDRIQQDIIASQISFTSR